MDNYNNKFKKSNFSFFDENGNEPYVETNILIREEAEFLARQFGPNESREDEFNNNSSSILVSNISDDDKTIEMLKSVIEDVVPNKDILLSFQNSMSTTIDKLNDIVTILKSDNALSNINSHDASYEIEEESVDSEDELIECFQKLIDLRMEETNYKLENAISDLDSTKNSFSELLNKYETSIFAITEKQKELSNSFENNKDYLTNLHKDVDAYKRNYENIELEIQKIYSIWTQNNKLLEKLEEIICDVTHSKFGYEVDLNCLLDELKTKTINNQEILSNMTTELHNLKEKFYVVNNNYNGFLSLYDKDIESINEKINFNRNQLRELRSSNEDEIDSIKNKIDNEFNSIKEKEYSTLERIVNLENQVEKNKEQISELSIKYEQLSDTQRAVDIVLSNDLFQKSLESKIENMIVENNNYIGDELRHKLDNFSTNVVSDVDDVRKMGDDLLEKVKNMENKVVQLHDEFHDVDNRDEIKRTLESIESNYHILKESAELKIEKALSKLDEVSSNNKTEEKDILDIFNSSHELNIIIKDKIRQAIDERLSDVEYALNDMETTLQVKIKDYNNKLLTQSLNDKIQIEASKIKNETLNVLYRELSSRDVRIDNNSDELLKNYDALMESNRILKNLEELILRQAEEFDGYRNDETNSISMIIDKISSQKLRISELEESLRKNIAEFNLYSDSETSQSLRRGLDAWRLEFSSDMIHMVKNLVTEEIKKQSFLSYIDKKNEKDHGVKQNLDLFVDYDYKEPIAPNNFFTDRVKDILNRLENSDLQKVFEQTVNLDVNIQDLEKQESNQTENDNLDWFYEKEYNEYISQKKRSED